MVLAALIVCAWLCNTNVKADDSNTYKLVWCDEFNGDSLNEKNWFCQLGGSGWGNNEWQTYTDEEKNIQVKDGLLNINILAEKTNIKTSYTSARICSSGKANFKFGKIEARIKVPGDNGLWPAFWMLGQNQPKGWPYCGEIDILETFNNYNFAQGTVHWENEISRPNKDSYSAYQTRPDDKTKWHLYGMIWDEKNIKFTLDNKVYGTVDLTRSDKSELRSDFYYFIINCAVGGNLPGRGPEEDFVSAKMLVDYVRVYQKASDKGGANFEANDVDIVPSYKTVYCSNGAKIAESTVKEGENFIIPKATKAKHVFLKWERADDKAVINNESRVYKNSTVNAVFEKISLKKATIKKAKSIYKKTVTVKFTAKGKYDGFQVKVGKKKYKTDSKAITVPKLKAKKKYKVAVRTYRVDSTGKCCYGKWSKSKKVKIK